VVPVRIDPDGLTGPTRGQAQGASWRGIGHGLFVSAGAPEVVEQRILECAATAPTGAMITGWAALRLHGGGFFDGVAPDGSTPLDVVVLVAHATRIASRPGVRVLRDSRPPASVTLFGVGCTSPERATYDAMRLAPDVREATVVMDMAAAAGITSIRRVRRFVAAQVRRPGLGQVRRALELASELSRSPQETRMRLVWVIDGHLSLPLVNAVVRDRSGSFVGIADLLDVEAGVAGEYDGALHRSRARHRSDNERLERFRDVGLETFTVVAGDDVTTQVTRMQAARSRALSRPVSARAWVVAPRDPREPTLDQRLDERDLIAEIRAQEG
jgi:hypothetical protein